MKESILYEIECNLCANKYYGETSQSKAERKKEHDNGQRHEDKENPLWKHDHIKHNKEKQKYKDKIIRKE